MAEPVARIRRKASTIAARQAREFVRDDEAGYQGRRVGVAHGDRGLTVAERMRALRFARYAFKRNGAYAHFIDRLVAHTVGDGIVIDSFADESTAFHVKRVLGESLNRWEHGLAERWRECLNEGEFLLKIETDRRGVLADGTEIPTGLPRFGRVELDRVKSTSFDASDPDLVMGIEVDIGNGHTQWYPIARKGVQPVMDHRVENGQKVPTGKLVAVAYWSVNRLGGRGTPFFLRILEKAQLLDDTVDMCARKGEYLNRYFVHGKYKGTGDDAKDAQFEEDLERFLEGGEGGETLVTSDGAGVEVNVLTPDLKLLDQRELYNLVVDFICGSAGVPTAWFGGGGDTNRATAIEQGSPAHRMLVTAQTGLACNVRETIDFIIWLGKLSGRIAMHADDSYGVDMSQISTRDTQREIGVLQQTSSFASHAKNAGQIHPHEEQSLVRAALRAQTIFPIELDAEPPEPVPASSGVADVFNDLPQNVREAYKEALPGHRKKTG